MSDRQERGEATASPFHPHEPNIPPALDDEGRCRVCRLIVERDALRARVTELENAAREVKRELLGTAHARIGICRGHCTDEEPHTVIDAELCSLDAQTYALAMRLRALLSDPEGGSDA